MKVACSKTEGGSCRLVKKNPCFHLSHSHISNCKLSFNFFLVSASPDHFTTHVCSFIEPELINRPHKCRTSAGLVFAGLPQLCKATPLHEILVRRFGRMGIYLWGSVGPATGVARPPSYPQLQPELLLLSIHPPFFPGFIGFISFSGERIVLPSHLPLP